MGMGDVRHDAVWVANCVELYAECRPPDPSAERRRSCTSSGTIVWRGAGTSQVGELGVALLLGHGRWSRYPRVWIKRQARHRYQDMGKGRGEGNSRSRGGMINRVVRFLFKEIVRAAQSPAVSISLRGP